MHHLHVASTPFQLHKPPSFDMPILGRRVSTSQGTITMFVSPLDYRVQRVDKIREQCHDNEG